MRAGEVLCALPLGSVRRVVRELSTFPLPGAGARLRGLAEFAGEPLAILDLARLVMAPPGATPPYPVTIVVWVGPASARELVGLAVDEACAVVEIAGDRVARSGVAGLIVGEATVGGEAVRVLDLEALGAAA